MNKKEKKLFKEKLVDIVQKYPQMHNNKLIYTFAGSISYMILALCQKREITKYHAIKNIIKRMYSYKSDKLFKKFLRPVLDFDAEFYDNKIYKNLSLGKNSITINSSNVIFERIKKNIQDQSTVYSAMVNGQKIFFDNFKTNFGFKLNTLAFLSPDRFYKDSPKYKYTKKKYHKDLHILYKIFRKHLGEDRFQYHILKSLNLFKKGQYFGDILKQRLKFIKIDKKTFNFINRCMQKFEIKKPKGIIIYAFPATGKTAFAKKSKNVLDLCTTEVAYLLSDKQKSLDKEYLKGLEKEENPKFESEYTELLEKAIEKYDYILVPYKGLEVVKKLGYAYWLVFPKRNLKSEYIKRMEKRGNNEEFISRYVENWDRYLIEKKEDKMAYKKIELNENEYLSDVISV